MEREERNSREKAKVAGILEKRYQEGMQIGADAALCYPRKIPSQSCTPSIIVEELYKDSPYNIRKKVGLPPTPISNPSKETILATLIPEVTTYYYYLHADDGQIYYGRTLEEHNANKRKYLR